MLCDLHIHSNNSFDAVSSVDEICKKAIDLGIGTIAITDHCEAEFINKFKNCEFGNFNKLIPQSISDTVQAIEKYKGKLKIIRGLELGEPMHDLEQTQIALEYGEFDFILASVHNLRERVDFYYMDYNRVEISQILNEYFDELAETATFEHFDSLAHLTYPLRYIFERKGFLPDLSAYSDKIDRIFNILIKNNKALEINVSGLFKPMKQTLPDLSLVKRFYELGGKYITIGTDAHTVDYVGKGIEVGFEVAKKAGFTHYTVFENHLPILIKL